MSMIGSLDRPPIVLRSTRTKAVLTVIGGLAFVAFGVVLLRLGETGPLISGLACIGFFGFIAATGMVQAFRPATLIIEPRGVTHHGPFRTIAFRWRDIENIQVVEIKRAKVVGFDLTDAYQGPRELAGLSRQLTGVDTGLPGGWTIGPDALAGLLAAALARWLDAEALVPRQPPSRRTPAPQDPPPIVR